jgi:predicted porin
MFNLGDFPMKKTLVAMAAFAAVSSFAQSSVTLYGRVDAGLFSNKTISSGAGTAAPVRISQVGIDNGNAVGLTGSRWGMRGTEDLGGGLKAGFKLENRFSVDTGAGTQAGPLLFGGESFLSLSGGFGTVKLGRIFTAFDDLRGIAVSKNNFDGAWTPVGDTYKAGVADYAGRGDNAIKFESANFGGISGALMYAFGENKGVGVSASNQVSAHIKYANGPLAVGFGLQNEKPVGTAPKTKHAAISASYDLGVVSLSGGYNNSKLDTAKDTEFSLGVTVPLGAAAISAGFASSKSKIAGAKDDKGSGFGISATYAMSKRTTLYTGLKSTNVKNAGGNKELDNDLFSVGVRHDF